jgi:cytochrome b involved in lipid metabolism
MVPKPCDLQQSIRLRSSPRHDNATVSVRTNSGDRTNGSNLPQLSDVAMAKSEALLESSRESSVATTSLSSKNPLPSQLWWIHDKGYDLDDFVPRHPGGVEAILLGKGRDCTAMVESYHPFSSQHWKVLEKYLVIEDYSHKPGHQPTRTTSQGQNGSYDFFYDILKERVSAVLQQKGIDPKEDRGATTQRALYYSVVFLSWIYTGYLHLSVRVCSMMCLVFPRSNGIPFTNLDMLSL